MALANAQLAFARRAGIAQALRSQRVIFFEGHFNSISETDSCPETIGATSARHGEPLYRGQKRRRWQLGGRSLVKSLHMLLAHGTLLRAIESNIGMSRDTSHPQNLTP